MAATEKTSVPAAGKNLDEAIKQLSDEPAEMEIERDVRALLHGTKEGRVVIENELPEVAVGDRKVVDEVHSGHVAEKEIIEGQVRV